jgi:hypothetical protein
VLPSSCGIAIADSKKSCACPPLAFKYRILNEAAHHINKSIINPLTGKDATLNASLENKKKLKGPTIINFRNKISSCVKIIKHLLV